MGFLATTFSCFIGSLTYEYTPNASPQRVHFYPVLKGADTKVVHTHSLIVGAVAGDIPLKQGLRHQYRLIMNRTLKRNCLNVHTS